MKSILPLALLVCIVVYYPNLQAQVNVKDSLALISLYRSTGGTTWQNHTNWLTKTPVKQWYGVTVDTIKQRVVQITLSSNNLAGALPDSLKIADSLRVLDVSFNKLTGTLPSSIGSFDSLQTLNLSNNTFSGNIPTGIGALVNLQTLNMSNNTFSGSIPSAIARLKNLKTLDLSFNKLAGPVSDSLSLLEKLTSFSLAYNNFTFDGIELVAQTYQFANYSPQLTLAVTRKNNTLSVAAGGTPANNSYYWYKNGVLYTVKKGDSTFTITDSASYYVVIKNAVTPKLLLYSSIVALPRDWVFIGVDSSATDKSSWDVYSMGYATGISTGVFAGGNFGYTGFWDRKKNVWTNDGATEEDGDAYVDRIATDNGLSPDAVVYRHTVGYNSGDYHTAQRTVNGWQPLPNSDEVDNIAANNLELYNDGVFPTGVIKPDGNPVLYGTEVWQGASWTQIQDTVVENMINQALGMTEDQTFIYETAMATNQSNLFKTYSVRLPDNSIKIFVFYYNPNSDPSKWTIIGNSITDYSQNFPPSRSGQQGGSVYSISVSQVGTTDIAIGGTFMNAAGNYYVAKFNPASNSWEQYGTWVDSIGGKFYPNEAIASLTRDAGGDIYVAGYFTNASGNPYVAKIDYLENVTALGKTVLPSAHINALCYGGQSNDDIYASGLFVDNNNVTNFLAHYSSSNCSQVTVTASSLVVAAGKPVTFTATGIDVGNNPLYIWKKNGYTMAVQSNNLYVDSVLRNGDTITCIVIGNAECSTAPVQSSVVMTVQNTLPLSFLSFTAALQKNNVLLQWQTANEINTSYFNIQRSTDGVNFTTVGKVNAEDNSLLSESYMFNDDIASINPAPSFILYRLQETDEDGKITYSNIAYIKLDKTPWSFTLTPNPVRSMLTINVANAQSQSIITIYDLTGRRVQQISGGGSSTVYINTSSLAKGTYMLQVSSGGVVKTQKFVKQ